MQQNELFATLLERIEGRLPQPEAPRADEEVIPAGAVPRELVTWLQAFHHLSAIVVLAPPPAAVRQRLNRQFEAFAHERRAAAPLAR